MIETQNKKKERLLAWVIKKLLGKELKHFLWPSPSSEPQKNASRKMKKVVIQSNILQMR